MSDRALLEELLAFIDSITIANHYNNLQRKAEEIRTRMIKTRWCGNCVDSYDKCRFGLQCMDEALHPSAKYWRWDGKTNIDKEEGLQ